MTLHSYFKKTTIMRRVIIFCLILNVFTYISAHEQRDLLQHKADLSAVKKSLILNQKWVNYPDYNNRAGWDKITGNLKQEIIAKGVANLNYEWKVIKATDYIEYERSGKRIIMEDPFDANNMALSNLVLAELAEGKGRFIDQIVNGVWQTCEMTSWALSAHIISAQSIKTSLPSPKEHVIDLTVGDVGSLLAWTYYFLKDEMDKVNPLISERLRDDLQERVLDPYMNRSDFWWQAFDSTPNTLVNNWNPWCNFNVLSCFLLLENDAEKLSKAVYRSMVSVDKFLNYTKSDGACEEGPSYWGHAAGKTYDYLQLLSTATDGKIDIFNQPMIKNMGEYISRSYVGNDWVVNFADASAKGSGPIGVIYRYGKAVNSSEMMHYAAYLYQREKSKSYYFAGRDMFRTIENLRSNDELVKTEPALSNAITTWYPETEFCYLRNQNGFFFAAKGGYNNESHNHNDAGTFSLWFDQTPIVIDAGVGTYTRQTFSSERYSIWTMRSIYHNLPLINGVEQSFGAQYKATKVKFDEAQKQISFNINTAYPQEALVNYWNRSYQLKADKLVIQDKFELSKSKAVNEINFMLWGNVQILKDKVSIEVQNKKMELTYDSKKFTASLDTIVLDDVRLSRVWGNQIYRLNLKAKHNQLKDSYQFIIQQSKKIRTN